MQREYWTLRADCIPHLMKSTHIYGVSAPFNEMHIGGAERWQANGQMI